MPDYSFGRDAPVESSPIYLFGSAALVESSGADGGVATLPVQAYERGEVEHRQCQTKFGVIFRHNTTFKNCCNTVCVKNGMVY